MWYPSHQRTRYRFPEVASRCVSEGYVSLVLSPSTAATVLAGLPLRVASSRRVVSTADAGIWTYRMTDPRMNADLTAACDIDIEVVDKTRRPLGILPLNSPDEATALRRPLPPSYYQCESSRIDRQT